MQCIDRHLSLAAPGCLRIRRLPGAALVALLLSLGLSTPCVAGGGFFLIDHEWRYDNSGIWKRNYQELLEYGLIAGEIGAGVWVGGETRFGHTVWQSIDASAGAGLIALGMKEVFSRVRPGVSKDDPNLWFKGHGNQSFPSGEVTEVSSIVTPFVLEYGREHPLTYGLELLPLYDAIARIKVQAHWQSDVLAGFALGTGSAWLIHRNPNSPFILQVMPHAIYIGLGKKF